jgi:hypothetical protein
MPSPEYLTKFDIRHTASKEIAGLRDEIIKRMAKKCNVSVSLMSRYVWEIAEMYAEFKRVFNTVSIEFEIIHKACLDALSEQKRS